MTANVCRISDVRCGAAALGSPSCGSPRGSISGSLLQAVAWAVGFIVAVLFLGPAASAGLIADWQFEGNVNDATGSYNATAVNSPTYAAGVIGQAFQADGGATVPDMGATYTTVTVAAWIKTYDANSPGSQAIFHNTRWASGTPHFLLEYGGGSPSPSRTGLVIGVNSSGGGVRLNNTLSPINESTWYHVAYTYDTPSSTLRLYIDGTEAGNANINSSVRLDLNSMVIGAGFSRRFNGLIDDLGVWNETLTDAKIKGISNFAVSSLNYGQSDVASLYGLGAGQSTTTSDGATWGYATGLNGTEGTVESLVGGLYAMNLGSGTGVQMTVAAPVPEPSTFGLLAAAAAGVAAVRCRRNQQGRGRS